MALPTTNLTLHCDASDTGQLFTTLNGGGSGIHTGTPGDGGAVQVWDDEGDGIADVALVYVTTGTEPNYRSGTPLMLLPCLDFDGSADEIEVVTQMGGAKAISTLLAAGAKTIAIAFYVEAATLNSGNPYSNHILFGDTGQFLSLSVRTSGGVYFLQFYNWDGNVDVVELSLNLSTSYVVVATHNGTNLTLTLITDNGGSETSATPVASGNTSSLSGSAGVGRGGGGGYFNGRVGEFALYNAVLAGTDLTDLKQYFYAKWLPSGGAANAVPQCWPSYRRRRMS